MNDATPGNSNGDAPLPLAAHLPPDPAAPWPLAGRLLTLMLRRGISQGQFARDAGTSQPAVSAILAGARRPRKGTLDRLLAALGATRAELLAAEPMDRPPTPDPRIQIGPEVCPHRLRALARRRGLRLGSLAVRAGIGKSTLSTVLARGTAQRATVAALARALEVEPADLAPRAARDRPAT